MFEVGWLPKSPDFITVTNLSERQLKISRALFMSMGNGIIDNALRPRFVDDYYRFEIPANIGIPEFIKWLQSVQLLIDVVIRICDAADATNPGPTE